MSGPKTYFTRNRYSREMFDGQLDEIFRLQARLRSSWTLLKSLTVQDAALGIGDDCSEFCSGVADEVRVLVLPVELDLPATFGDTQYRRCSETLQRKRAALKSVLDRTETEEGRFRNSREDIYAYQRHAEHCLRCSEAVRGRQAQMASYLATNLNVASREGAALIGELNSVETVVPPRPFATGFRRKEDRAREEATDRSTLLFQKMESVREKAVSDTEVELPAASVLYGQSAGTAVEGIVKDIVRQIHTLEDEDVRQKFAEALARLQASSTASEAFYYRELKRDVEAALETAGLRREVGACLRELAAGDFPLELAALRAGVLEEGCSLLDDQRLKRYQVEELERKCRRLREEEATLAREKAVQEAERAFLRRHLVQALERTGFEALLEADVVDFGETSEYLLRVPNQTNHINLRFKSDGKLLYSFFIQEDSATLGPEAERRKRLEMEQACAGFKRALKQLEAAGVDLARVRHVPTEEAQLLTLPVRHRSRVEERAKVSTRTQTQKKKELLTLKEK